MNYKWLVLFLFLFAAPVSAAQSERLAVVYMTEEGEVNERVVMLESILSHFGTVDLLAADDVKKGVLADYDYAVWIGDVKGRIPAEAAREIGKFPGAILAFGYNAEQLLQFDGWRFLGEQPAVRIDGEALDYMKMMNWVRPPRSAEILAEAETIDHSLPFIVQNGNVSYVATAAFGMEEKYELSRHLYQLLGVPEPVSRPAYITLTGITPASSAASVKKAGEFLAERNIPFILSVSPVYINVDRDSRILLSDNKRLVAVLQSLQKSGGIIVARGYNETYRVDERYAGYEFWDMKYNQPISSAAVDAVPSAMESSGYFSSDQAFADYRASWMQAETAYIDNKHRLAIETLVEHGLYPAGFTVPQYMMSSNGYRVTAAYFSALFGRVQMSDYVSGHIDMPLFIAKPAYLAGMTLYPETMGYIDSEQFDPLLEVRERIQMLKEVPGAALGAIYPAYLGTEYLAELIQMMEAVPDMEWLDISSEDLFTTTSEITIRKTAAGFQAESSIAEWRRWVNKMKAQPLNAALWFIVAIVAVFLLAFAAYTLSMRLRLKKRLFEERDSLG